MRPKHLAELNSYYAFSLPEIILVIGVIGFFALLVISPFLHRVDRDQYVLKLKKAYSEFNSVLTQVASSNGCTNDLKCTGLLDYGTSDQTFGDEVAKHYRILKNCKTMQNLGCMSDYVSINYDGTASRTSFDDASYKFITSNGTAISIVNYANNCMTPFVSGGNGSGGHLTPNGNGHTYTYRYSTQGNSGCSNDANGDDNGNNGKNDGKSNDNNGSGNGNNGNNNNEDRCVSVMIQEMGQVCGHAYIDVNGPMNGPNNIGRDIFTFWITNGKGPILYPMGGRQDYTIGWWKSDTTGAPEHCYFAQTHAPWCTGRVMEEGWEMNY